MENRMFAEKLKSRVEQVKQKILETIPVAPESVVTERMNICLECEHYFSLTSQCSQCGCFLKAKTKLAGSSCPIKKWDIYQE